MRLRLYASSWFAICLITIAALHRSADAKDRSTFKKGDEVEVREGIDWVPGVVVGVNRLGWPEVRVDDPDFRDFMQNAPAEFRERAMTRRVPPDDIRPRQTPKKEKPVESAPLRTWTDRSGKFSVDARYTGTEDGKVALVKADGKKISVPLEKLSDEDKAYIKRLVNEPPQNPFTVANEADAAPSGPPSKETDWHEAKEIQRQNLASWTFVPGSDAVSTLEPTAGNSATVKLGDLPQTESDGSILSRFSRDNAGHVKGIYPSSDNQRALIWRQESIVDSKGYLELVDVSKNKSDGLTGLPPSTIVVDADVDAGMVMYRPNELGPGSNEGLLTIARLENGTFTTIVQWTPYGRNGSNAFKEIDEAWFLDKGHVLTLDRFEAFVVWSVPDLKPLLRIPIGQVHQLVTGLSADRKLLAFGGWDTIYIFDLEAGKQVAALPYSGMLYGHLAFRADNARLAAMTSFGVNVWDLTSGKKTVDFNTPVQGSYDAALDWTGPFLLAGNQYLYDVDRRILLWEYYASMRISDNAKLHKSMLWIVPQDGFKSVVLTNPVPHPSVVEFAKTLPPADELLVAKAGDAVSIEVEIDPRVQLSEDVQKLLKAGAMAGRDQGNDDEKIVMLKPRDEQSDLIRKALASSLQRAGYQVVDKSNMVVKAICKPESPRTVRIGMGGRSMLHPENVVERTITPHSTYLEFSMNGKTLWKHGTLAKPIYNIYLEKGETLDDALRRYTQPNMLLFTHMTFGSCLARPGSASENGAYGVSEISERGLKDKPPTGPSGS